MGMAVATEKTLQTQHITILGTTDDYRPAGSGLQQADAAQDERPHDPFAELWFRDQQRTQSIRRNDQGFYCCLRRGVHQRWPAGELGELAHELPRCVRNDQFVAPGFITLHDVQMATQHNDEAQAHLSNPRDCFARPKNSYVAEPTHPLDLRRLQSRKHLGPPRLDDPLY